MFEDNLDCDWPPYHTFTYYRNDISSTTPLFDVSEPDGILWAIAENNSFNVLNNLIYKLYPVKGHICIREKHMCKLHHAFETILAIV